MVDDKFLFSVPSGEPVDVEPFHYCIIGQTQFSGKTTLIKRLAQSVVTQGYKVLIFDTKETEADYAGFGQDIPVCMREERDALVLLGLLESVFKRRLTNYYATLGRLVDETKDNRTLIAHARELESSTRSGWAKDAFRTLADLMDRLDKEISKVKTVPHLQLADGISRMVINRFSLEAQQLIVKNAFEDSLTRIREKLILVVDEAFKFLPQEYSSAATRAIMNVMTQGAKTGLFGWISTQYLAVTNKDPLKACAIKFLGTQDHTTEVKHTLDLVPEAKKYTSQDIMQLKLGHWILVRKRPADVREVYATPMGVPASAGISVAKGHMTPEQVRDRYLKGMTTKESETEDLGKIEELQAKLAESEGLRKAAVEHAVNAIEANKECKEEIKKQADQLEEQRKELTELHVVKNFLAPLEVFVKTIVRDAIPIYSQAPRQQGQPDSLSIKAEQLTVRVEKPSDRYFEFDTGSHHGKIVYMIAVERQGKPTTIVDIVNGAKEHGWPMVHSNIARDLPKLVSQGVLVREGSEPETWRTPSKVKIEVQEVLKK